MKGAVIVVLQLRITEPVLLKKTKNIFLQEHIRQTEKKEMDWA